MTPRPVDVVVACVTLSAARNPSERMTNLHFVDPTASGRDGYLDGACGFVRGRRRAPRG